MEHIISMKNIKKIFKDTVALENLNFDVKEGEVFGFLGPNGAGKTTTIKILTSQLIQTSGEAKVFGKDVFLHKKEIYPNIGILSDNSGLYERLTVEDNLELFADINQVPYSNIDEVLELVELLDSKKKFVKKLSKGMKQKLMIARAILHKPKLLFLDEPTSALDPGTTLEIHKLLKKFNKEGTTIFLTTHNMQEADKLCDRVAFLNNGRITETGSPIELKTKYANGDIKVILKENNKVVIVKNNTEGATQIKTWIEQGQILSIHSMEPNLEEIFLKVTGREL